MSLVFKKSDTFTVNVEVTTTDDRGRNVDGSFLARCKYIDPDTFKSYQRKVGEALGEIGAASKGDSGDLASLTQVRLDIAREVLEGVSGIGDGKEEFSAQDQLSIVLNHAGFTTAVVEKFFEAYGGAKRGNSNKSRGS